MIRNILKLIDDLLNKITMYRVVVYELIVLLVIAGIFGFFGILPYGPIYLLFSIALIYCVCWLTNEIFARIFEVPSNPESIWITVLILALIITPPSNPLDLQFLAIAFWASAWSMASKYILAIRGKQVFNPAAIGVAITSAVLGLSASWWIGTPIMVPFVLIGGLLIVRKIHRFDLFVSFIGIFILGIAYFNFDHGLNILTSLNQSLLYTPVFFFGTVMLTEPATTPPSRLLRILYGAGVGFLFLPNVSVGSFYFTPELALLVGNIFAYIVSPKYKMMLRLKEIIPLSPDSYEFAYTSDRPIKYKPGQYMELTLEHADPDNRSVRRYFTLSSSPTEPEIKLGIKFYEPASSFKKALLSMRLGSSIMAGQLSGDFTLPKNKKRRSPLSQVGLELHLLEV